jgi:hypothetical protein
MAGIGMILAGLGGLIGAIASDQPGGEAMSLAIGGIMGGVGLLMAKDDSE